MKLLILCIKNDKSYHDEYKLIQKYITYFRIEFLFIRKIFIYLI